jgi:predicted nucleotidyltransferase component of viral defense system
VNTPRDRAESIRHKIRNAMRARGENVEFGLQRYAAERFLHRLGASPYRDRLILKGAALYALWGGSAYRPTRDLDFTGYGSSEIRDIVAMLREICAIADSADGLVFDASTLEVGPIRDEAEYGGIRARFDARLGTSRIPMQIDIGFGNAIQPGALDVEYPTLLDMPAPKIRAYPQEAVVAEKLHAMVVLGERNSRYKDFYDVHALATQFPFEGEPLTGAIRATFERRQTTIVSSLPVALTPRYFADAARAASWSSYLDRDNLPGAPRDFGLIGEVLQGFLRPLWAALAAGDEFNGRWPPAGPWIASTPVQEPLA